MNRNIVTVAGTKKAQYTSTVKASLIFSITVVAALFTDMDRNNRGFDKYFKNTQVSKSFSLVTAGRLEVCPHGLEPRFEQHLVVNEWQCAQGRTMQNSIWSPKETT